MSTDRGPTTPATTEPPVGTPPAEDPLAADRRTLAIGAASMVGLILVGVVSAQLFNRGGCPDLAAPVPASGEVTDDVAGAVVALGADENGLVAGLGDVLGAPPVAAATVGDATGLLVGTDGIVATGATTTALDGDLAPTVELTGTDTVVGSGELFHLVLPNEITGQVDAITPLDGTDLTSDGCLDTTVVGAAFAFLLGAGDDQLALFRADEDGDGAVAELRDGRQGALWERPWELPGGPVGTLAERLSGVLADDVLVTARRLTADDAGPAVEVTDRSDGTVVAAVDLAELAGAAGVDSDVPVRVETVAAGETVALVTVRRDPARAPEEAPPEETVLAAVAYADGAVGRVGVLDGPVVAAAAAGDRFALLTGEADTELTVVDGELGAPIAIPGEAAAVAWHDGRVLAATDRAVTAVDGEASRTHEIPVTSDLQVLDLAIDTDGRVVVLVRSDGRSLVVRTDAAA